NYAHLFWRAGNYVDKILRGAKPGDPSGRAADQVRAGRQSDDRQGARPHGPGDILGARRRGDRMKRREFIALLSGATAWPLAARAQQPERMRRIGVLQPFPKDSPEKARIEGVPQGIAEIGVDRWSQCTNRVSLADQRFAESRNGIGGIVSGRHPRQQHSRCRCKRRPRQYRSYLRRLPIRSVPALLPVWRSLAATLPGSWFSIMKLPRNGSNYSRRLRPT